MAAYPVSDRFFWHQGKDLFFMEQFNDTIYQVTADALLPVRLLIEHSIINKLILIQIHNET